MLVIEGSGGLSWTLAFAESEELAEGGHGGDGYSDVLFDAVEVDRLVVMGGMRQGRKGIKVEVDKGEGPASN